MPQKKTRIGKKKDFENVFKNGKSVKGFFLAARVMENNLKTDRFAFIVSKKVSPKAVIRNKIRRRLLESTRGIKTEKYLDVVLIAFPRIKDKNFFEIKEEVEKILKKVK